MWLFSEKSIYRSRKEEKNEKRLEKGMIVKKPRCLVIGVPNVGKSTLFNALTSSMNAQSANYPFCTIEPNVGVVTVPDERLEVLAKLCNAKEIIPTAIEFVDIAGLVKGASQGEGLGNKFLSHIREVDAIIHVVRCFENDDITHVDGSIDPARDIETINLELVLSDLDILSRRLDNRRKAMKGDKKLAGEVEFLERLVKEMEEGKTARACEISDEEKEYLKDVSLLTIKPVIYACNMGENDFVDGIDNNKFYNIVKEIAAKEGAETFPICAEMEAQIAELDADEKEMFLEDMGLEKSGLDRLIKKSYSLLGLISYLTAGKPEVRAWTIKKGTKAPLSWCSFQAVLSKRALQRKKDLSEAKARNM